MHKVTVNRDGSIGPFADTTAAEEWLANRLDLLCMHTRQKGAPEARILAVDTSGHECVYPAVYDSSTDSVRLHYTPTENDVFDVAAVDGMLLHALGHRARRARSRALRWCGWALAAAALAFACVAAFREDLTPALATVLAALAVLAVLHIAALAHAHWTAEAAADDYALDHGGPRPILAFLRRMDGDPVSESAIPRARPGRRIMRLQSRMWAYSTLDTDQPVLRPIAEPGFGRPQ
ncbi:hypothetical protein [Rhodococcus sp. ACT016]|uniref:hypothetical protein n=1 Tax=Rhodococcus sp. ACT016 TaxID=3134808 RepID=UPI003D2B00BE